MELKLDRKEVEAIVLIHINRVMPEAALNAVRVHPSYGTFEGMTLSHSDLPPEAEDA